MGTLVWVYFYASAWVVAVILGAAALHKLRSSAEFIGAFAGYRLVPEVALKLWWVIPGLEVLAVIELLLSAGQSRWLATALFTLYGLAIAINLLRGRRDIDCGCGGDGTPISWTLVLRNVVLVALTLPQQIPNGAFTLNNGLLMSLTAVFCLLGYAIANQLLANSAR